MKKLILILSLLLCCSRAFAAFPVTGTTQGGTGNNWGTAAVGSMFDFTSTGIMGLIAPEKGAAGRQRTFNRRADDESVARMRDLMTSYGLGAPSLP